VQIVPAIGEDHYGLAGGKGRTAGGRRLAFDPSPRGAKREQGEKDDARPGRVYTRKPLGTSHEARIGPGLGRFLSGRKEGSK
jgi:hypothetical protein